MKPLIVGELNPYGVDPRYALYPLPERSAGGRLCRKIMELGRSAYLEKFDRANLCQERWSVVHARLKADQLKAEGERPIVLLGAKVCKAFGVPFIPFSTYGRYVVLPHPSGRCRLWNEPTTFERARAALRSAGVL